MNPTLRAYLELHFAVLLFGLTAILGKLISLSAINLVWWRVLIAGLSLLFFVPLGQLVRKLSFKQLLIFIGIGCLVGVHWITFYGAIKLANASIALVCFATTSFFTALTEPLILQQKVKWHEIGIGLLIIPGMALIVSNLDASMLVGFGVGIFSALLAAIFSTFNKKFVELADAYSITFLELSSAWLLLSLLVPIYIQQTEATFLPTPQDWIYLLILSLICTTLAFTLSLRALKHISAFASNLTFNLEPVYGILLAWLLLGENKELSPLFYVGVVVILLAVFTHPYISKRFEAKNLEDQKSQP